MKPDLSKQRCYHHKKREAAARCPDCGRYVCRECITEHEDRVLCASCLNKLTSDSTLEKFQLRTLNHFLLASLGWLTIWLFFYYLGQALLSIPSSFHDGDIWNTTRLFGK